jgi:hypothetical protein
MKGRTRFKKRTEGHCVVVRMRDQAQVEQEGGEEDERRCVSRCRSARESRGALGIAQGEAVWSIHSRSLWLTSSLPKLTGAHDGQSSPAFLLLLPVVLFLEDGFLAVTFG